MPQYMEFYGASNQTNYKCEHWIEVRHGKIIKIGVSYQSILELARICLVEPISLAMFPFYCETGIEFTADLISTEHSSASTEKDEELSRTDMIKNLCPEAVQRKKKLIDAIKIVSTGRNVNTKERLKCDQRLRRVEAI